MMLARGTMTHNTLVVTLSSNEKLDRSRTLAGARANRQRDKEDDTSNSVASGASTDDTEGEDDDEATAGGRF